MSVSIALSRVSSVFDISIIFSANTSCSLLSFVGSLCGAVVATLLCVVVSFADVESFSRVGSVSCAFTSFAGVCLLKIKTVIIVTKLPIMTAIKNQRTLSIPPSTATTGPPWATLSPTPPSAAMTDATIAPIILAGIVLSGSWAAKGIAPSVIPKSPIVNEALPISCSALLNLRF